MNESERYRKRKEEWESWKANCPSEQVMLFTLESRLEKLWKRKDEYCPEFKKDRWIIKAVHSEIVNRLMHYMPHSKRAGFHQGQEERRPEVMTYTCHLPGLYD